MDHQLYKALEHQYQLGLEALNENLPEIKVELVFRYVFLAISLECVQHVSPFRSNHYVFHDPLSTLLSQYTWGGVSTPSCLDCGTSRGLHGVTSC